MIKLSTARYDSGYHGIVTTSADGYTHEMVTPRARPDRDAALEDARQLAQSLEVRAVEWITLGCPRCGAAFSLDPVDYRHRLGTAKRRGTPGRIFCSRRCANSYTMIEKNRAGKMHAHLHKPAKDRNAQEVTG